MCCVGLLGQLRSGHYCTCRASCKACPPMVQEVPAMAISRTCNSNHGLQQLKGISITMSTPFPLDQPVGFNIAMKSSPCPCSSLYLPTDCSPLGLYLLQVEPQLRATAPAGVYLLQHGLTHSRSCFEVHLLQHGLMHGP